MKKILSVIISISILLASLCGLSFEAFADIIASGSCGASGNTMSWSLDSQGKLTISANNQRMADYYVGSNNAPWYQYKDSITELVVENGVINLGAYAFANLQNLKTVDFGNIDTIGNNTFEGCTSLEYAILPDNCTWIWANAFNGCTSLKAAYINSVNSYGNSVPIGMFSGCTSLKVLELGSTINKLEENSLQNCSSLTALVVNGSSLTLANVNAISGTNKACTVVSSASSVQTFANNNGFKYSDCKSGVVSDNTFSNKKLTYTWDTKTLSLKFTGSGDMKFYDNGAQPWYIFTDVMKKVDFSNTNGGVSLSTTAFQGREAIEELDLSNVKAVGWGTFAECSSIKDLQFDSCLEAIWNYAFANDTSIDKIQFKDGSAPLHIYPFAFNNCNGTTYWINIPSNARYIDDHAFIGTNFNYVTINSSNIVIGEDAFGNGEGGYARFFGVGGTNTGVYYWVVSSRQSKGYNWHYYCINDNHYYSTRVISPTCLEQGYELYGCEYCDADNVKSNYTPALGHAYHCVDKEDSSFFYVCDRCAKNNIEINAFELKDYLILALSNVAGNLKFQQVNYDGRADVNFDGVVNGKDFKIIRNALNSADLTDKGTIIDLNTTYQTVDGFGASAAWWSQTVGNWENAEEIVGLLYGKENGIGLNIYRYNLGAGSRDINDTTMYIDDERTNCFLKSDGTYDWNNDSGAMRALSIANGLNKDLKVTLFSNSAPVYMTNNGRAYVSPNESSNLSSNKFQAFADFTATCAEHFIDEGYNVTELSPINEPEWGWNGWINGDGTTSCGQEGCHYTPQDALNFYNNYMIPTVKARQKLNGRVGVSVWECAQMYHSDHWSNYLNNLFSSKETKKVFGIVTQQGYADKNQNIRSYVDAVDTHSYWADEAARRNVASDINGQYFGQKVRCTEYCQMYNDYSTGVVAHINAEGGSTNGMSIDYGLAMADIIYQDMTILNAIEWDWWTAVGRGVYTDSLIYVKNGNHSYETSKRLWCLGNYSKFIQEGAKRVQVTTENKFANNLRTDDENIYTWDDEYGNHVVDKNNYLEESAYLNPDGSVAVVYINNSDTTEFTTFDGSVYNSFTSYVTDSNRDLVKYQTGNPSSAVCIPARSVTTVVLNQHSTPVKSEEGAYLFAYFTGNSTQDQKIHFAVSNDGYNYQALNNNSAVIEQNLGTKNCRDPYIFKGQDNYYYIVATDMDASNNQWWGNSNSIVYWKSADLINWSSETVISMYDILADTKPQVDDIQRMWAPQVIWDDRENKYFVYFAMASWSLTQNVTRLYYCYTDDLLDANAYSDPELLYTSADDGLTLDADIMYNSEEKLYYLYFKDEEEAKIYYTTSKYLAGPYENATLAIKSDTGLEGCNSYFINGTDTMVMMVDAYGEGRYLLYQSNNMKDFYEVNSDGYSVGFSPRHGSVLHIGNDEYRRLIQNY